MSTPTSQSSAQPSAPPSTQPSAQSQIPESAASSQLVSINPATGQLIQQHLVLNEHAIERTIARAQGAYDCWRQLSYSARGEILKKVAKSLRSNKQQLGQLMTDEMGKPVKEAGPEVEKAAWCAEHYAEFTEAYLADEPIASDASHSYVHYQPLGPVLGIMPWNSPLWVTFRFLAPALMAGNTCVLKHDPHVQGCAQGIIQAFIDAGAPSDIVVNLPIENSQIEAVIRHPSIQAISFTGSARAGAIVAAQAASEIKPCVLELGGSDPCVILADADIDQATDIVTLSRTINAGQSCIAAKRVIVEAPIYSAVVERLKAKLGQLVVGDPNQLETDIGPLARDDLRQTLHRQVQQTIHQGARCLLGGEMPSGDGFYYPVTLLVDVPAQSCAMVEETFGPVMVVSCVEDAAQALSLANDTEYGLGAAIWTQSEEKARYFAEQLIAGQVAVNGIVKTDPRLPSGGVKRSGYGRELGPHGIKEFVNAKQIWLK
ncbi:Succinate semialdehyde dehydrogenase [NAD(P)+] Sad [Vibrio stylophorae]|uniref:Succinate semialdehyde dehydrogenase [NAD(P)+] Sad n=1 Tax=Vibrio stylophorae TaxID=659351 RepID=A0ABN8DS01_9VIBR|nr:NAD-dependent succinate-semialdehyde dehydrogenase [Vibrio stylophorae]CAH0533570.1 Succinate semialdehyde dehydrogenase [NAD(P)+] Sad [Vibrio stylophorae]